MSYAIKQSSTQSCLMFLMIQSSDHITGLTGASPTVVLSKNGASFASPAGSVTEVGNGWYKVAGNATDTNTLGPLALHATAASADPSDCLVAEIVAYDPQDAVHLGLTCLPNTAVTTNASLLTSGTGTDQLSVASGRIDLGKILGTASAGAAGYVGLDWGHVNAPTTTVGLTNTTIGSGQVVASVTGAVGSVTGAVGSVTGAVGSVTAGVTVTTNNDKTGYTVSTVSDKTGYSLSTAGVGAIFTTQLTEAYAAQGVVPTCAQILFESRALQAEKAVASTTLTTKKIDGSTQAATYTLSDAVNPVSITRAT